MDRLCVGRASGRHVVVFVGAFDGRRRPQDEGDSLWLAKSMI
jgi:hypothetical protein